MIYLMTLFFLIPASNPVIPVSRNYLFSSQSKCQNTSSGFAAVESRSHNNIFMMCGNMVYYFFR